ncbi:NAD(P)H-binding protein [Nostoc sp.]|uniref:NAD(P)H-binding protein n=1 Tax=Nostoc sp. TaxID=1180 RepID=UPI002FF56593
MKLVMFGPTGMIGSRILNEALSRGHSLTAITRDPSRFSVEHEKLAVVAGNVFDPANAVFQTLLPTMIQLGILTEKVDK